jgi:predicted enzyme related to lactoylglutathione lyase
VHELHHHLGDVGSQLVSETQHSMGVMDVDAAAREELLRRIDAVTVPVPDLDAGLRFYGEVLGHHVAWRNDDVGQAGLELPDGDSELVLTTEQRYEPNWLVASADEAVQLFRDHGGSVVAEPADIPVGRVGVVVDPCGNVLDLVDLSKGTYVATDRGTSMR